MSFYQQHTFTNGIRLVYKEVTHTKIAHCGLILNIGSRDELPEQEGIAHFWEHMAFKGTQKRKSYHILNRIDSVGGELNAHTTKENIFFYSSLLSVHLERAVELLTDITFSATFPDKELQRERSVILEEISLYQDDPADAISDEFDAVVYKDHSLGQNILGTRKTVSSFKPEDFKNFVEQHLDTTEVVMVVVAPLPFAQVLKTCSRYLEGVPAKSAKRQRRPFTHYTPSHKQREQSITQAHCISGGLAPGVFSDDRLSFFVLTNLLGGPAMNSRLNLAIRERYGFVYDIQAQVNNFTDTGLFAIQFATEPNTLQKCMQLVNKELHSLRTKPLGTRQLQMAQQQLKGQLAMAEESNQNLMLYLGKHVLNESPIETIEEIFKKIEQIGADELLETANKYLQPDQFCSLIYLPENA
jgi:predicted Zn-dependent peptidase